ncbi:MAG TPA: APC family permease [Ktedonobacteraceae bacterium]|jgi:amino acid transporter|nr:APC family permease [Ktedonobacteraceae bacterium]
MSSPQTIEDQTSAILPSETYVEKAMPQFLQTFDLLAMFIVAIFFIVNAPIAASGGMTAYMYWFAGCLTFFLPSVIAVAQLGVIFPGEGSLYTWTHHALGPYWAFFASTCYWFPIPLILVSCSDTIVGFIQGLHSNWLVEPWQQGLTICAIVLLSGVIACQPAKVVQHLVNWAAGLIVFAIVLLVLATVLWLSHGRMIMTSFLHASDWSIGPQNFGLFSLVTLAYLGAHVPLNLGGEIRGNRTKQGRTAISTHLLWGGLFVFVGYIVVTMCLQIVQGPVNGSVPFALVMTVEATMGNVAGGVMAICIMAFFLIAAVMYNASFSRILLIGAIDEQIPVSVGLLNKNRVPARAVILQTSLALIVAVLVFIVVPYIFKIGTPAALATEFYTVGQAFVSIIWALITLFLYINLAALSIRAPELLKGKRLFPSGVIWLAIVVGPLGCFATIAGALEYSWIPQQIPNGIWGGIILGLVLTTAMIVGVGSIYATSVAAWERLSSESGYSAGEESSSQWREKLAQASIEEQKRERSEERPTRFY